MSSAILQWRSGVNKRTPQEWADITGCYVVCDRGRGCFDLYEEKPEINTKEGWWEDTGGNVGCLPRGAVDVDLDTQDWTTLYEPRKADNAPHQSEVFINQEYLVLQEDSLTDISSAVSLMISKGYRPAGGVACSDGYFYQAMTRGI